MIKATSQARTSASTPSASRRDAWRRLRARRLARAHLAQGRPQRLTLGPESVEVESLGGNRGAVDSSMSRRDAFVAEIAETVKARHGEKDESFVFGLSGKWGEGKTHFLGRLRRAMESLGFETLDLTPWKYSADRVAFLRSFLVQLLETQSWKSRLHAAQACHIAGKYDMAWRMLLPRRRMLAALQTDVNRSRIAWWRLVSLVALVLGGYWVYTTVLSPAARAFISDWKVLLTAVLIPVLLWVVQGLVTSQVSSKAATTVDQFDELVTLALGACPGSPREDPASCSDRRIVVFVDDLDRVTPEVARGVLDNLRTFFDKPSISFVVTGDHTVLEASLGRELLPDSSSAPERMEEGRRFLKKVFNIYWQLPHPVRSDFEQFVDGELDSRRADLRELVPDQRDQENLRDWLLAYSDLNARQVIRTVDALLFTLRLVRAQLASAVDEEKGSLQEMIARPMLLGRVLMIQDRCAPFFAVLVEQPDLMLQLDREIALAQAKAESEKTRDVVGDFIKRVELKLSPEQQRFLTSFAYQRPLFYDPAGGGQVVANLGPWIHLTGDTSFTDESGPQPADFVRDLTNKNRESLNAAFRKCSESRAPSVAKAAVSSLASMMAPPVRGENLVVLLGVAAEAGPGSPLVRETLNGVVDSFDVMLDDLADESRVLALAALAAVLDRQGADRIPDRAASAFGFRAQSDLQFVPSERTGPLGSAFVLEWLRASYAQNAADSLGPCEVLLPSVAPAAVAAELTQFGESLASDVISDVDEGRRNRRLALILQNIPEGQALIRGAVFGELWRDDVWAWALRASSDDERPWCTSQARAALVGWVCEAPDRQELVRRLHLAANKVGEAKCDLWQALTRDRFDDVSAVLDSLDFELVGMIAPPMVEATALYQVRAAALSTEEDESVAIAVAQRLNPDLAFWENLDRKRAAKSLQQLARTDARRQQLQAVVRPYWLALRAE